MYRDSQGQLEHAVRREDFAEAASLKRAIDHTRRACPVAEIERGYARAVAEEDYAAAASFRDDGAGLVGWWCGRGETEDEPGGQYGVMLQITPEHGRYVGVSYSARDLAALQERRRRGGGSGSTNASKSATDTHSSSTDPLRSTDDPNALEPPVGACVFELWLEKDRETGELRRRAVRVDHFPAGALDADDADVPEAGADDKSSSLASGEGFATALGGFPFSGPIDLGGGGDSGGPAHARGAGDSEKDLSGQRKRDDEEDDAANPFAGWRVSNGTVRVETTNASASSARSNASQEQTANPFPFDVDGVRMEELLSYERQGFMADFARTPGFAETWARLKAAHAAEDRGRSDRGGSDLGADPDVFEAFGGSRGAERAAARGARREPRDEYFFEKFVINETDGDAGIIDLDDLDDEDDAFELEDLLGDDDDDGVVVDLDAAAAALLNGGGPDRAPKGLPAAMAADIQRAIEARGMGRAVFPEHLDDADSEDDPWAVEEVRIPVDMAMDGLHAFRLWSDDEEEDDDESGLNPGLRTLDRAVREAAEAEIEAAVRRGLSDAKARVAEELRTAASDASPVIPEKGQTETVAVNFDAGPRDAGAKRGIEPGTSPSPPGELGGAEEKRAAFDAPDAPPALGGDASAMRFSSGSAETVFGAGTGAPAEKEAETTKNEKSAGERFFERLLSSGADLPAEAKDDGARKESDGDRAMDARKNETEGAEEAKRERAKRDVAPPRGFISPASFSGKGSPAPERSTEPPPSSEDPRARDAEARSESEAAKQSATDFLEALGDTDALPLPGKTRFARVPPSVARRSSSDPFDRLYLGAFGPHGPEVLRLVRGRWGDERGVENNCVTAVKLTGDANVPAGAASFRARVGPGDALDSSFSYPEELGVVTRFKGQGRLAKPGFAERNWVDGELLLLDGRGGQLTGGAELGFVWAVPGERRLLILFSSLELPETASARGAATYID